MGVVIAHICPKHGFQTGANCSQCESVAVKGPNVNTGAWVKGWYEHIDTKPIYIESKQQLFAECEKRGHLAKAFMKPKSQGVGWEHKRR